MRKSNPLSSGNLSIEKLGRPRDAHKLIQAQPRPRDEQQLRYLQQLEEIEFFQTTKPLRIGTRVLMLLNTIEKK
jgi:hypothetical protein